MRRRETRHYTEEEILLHVLEEDNAEVRPPVAEHLDECGACGAVRREYLELMALLRQWELPAVPAARWSAARAAVMDRFREDQEWLQRKGLARWLHQAERIWNYALSNPLPTVGYVAAALAFASERTITLFRLDEALPGTAEVLDILRQILGG